MRAISTTVLDMNIFCSLFRLDNKDVSERIFHQLKEKLSVVVSASKEVKYILNFVYFDGGFSRCMVLFVSEIVCTAGV